MVNPKLRIAFVLAAITAAAPAAARAAGSGLVSIPSSPYTGYDVNRQYQEGFQHLAKHEYHLAKESFERVLTEQPHEPVALYNLGLAEAGLRDWRGAEQNYQAALHQDPSRIDAARELAIAEEKLHRHDRAVIVFDKLKARADACGDSCPDAAELAASVKADETALGLPDGSADRPTG